MSRAQVIILVVLGVLIVLVFYGLGASVHETMSWATTARVVHPGSPTSVPAATAAKISVEAVSLAVYEAGEQDETTRRVEALLRELGYHVIGVRAITGEKGDRVLATCVRGSYTGAEDALIEINTVVSLYVSAASPPFDCASVVIFSAEDKVVVTSIVLREDVEAWLDGRIGTEQFVNRIAIQSQ